MGNEARPDHRGGRCARRGSINVCPLRPETHFHTCKSAWHAVRCRQMPSDAVRCRQMPSDAVRCRQMPSDAVRCRQMPSAHVLSRRRHRGGGAGGPRHCAHLAGSDLRGARAHSATVRPHDRHAAACGRMRPHAGASCVHERMLGECSRLAMLGMSPVGALLSRATGCAQT